MYGIIPRAKIENWEKNPPANKLYKPKILPAPVSLKAINCLTTSLSTPGTSTIPPNLKTNNKAAVKAILFLNSGTLNIFTILLIINK